jgi:hypothetical protein
MGGKSKRPQGRSNSRPGKNSRVRNTKEGQTRQRKDKVHRLSTLRIELIGVIIGVLLTVVFTGILGPDPFAGVRRYVVAQWRIHFTSDWDRLVSDYLEQTRTANIWMQEPAMYPDSEKYFRDHPWGELNPQVPHKLSDVPQLEVRPIEELVPESKAYAGRIVGTVGVIKRRPSKWDAMPNIPEWVIQIQSPDPGHKYESIYCRVTTAPNAKFKEGDVVGVNGLILGAGQVRQADGPGILDVAYMACSAIEKMPRPKAVNGKKP